jgi:enoyl-CoA hydratase
VNVTENTDVVLLEKNGAVATITINRPAALNALNSAVLSGLELAIDSLAADRGVRVVVVTGTGKAFVAGADISQMRDLDPNGARAFAALGHRVFDKLAGLRAIVIAAVNGFALGGGCELSLACDLVYASAKARFGQPEVNLGLMPGFGGTQRLARRVGAMRALELTTTARLVRADEAKTIGLCLDVFAPEELMEKVQGIAAGIASKGPIAVRACKGVQRLGLEAPLATGNGFEQDAFALLFASTDAKEGMSAFLEKRAAAFTDN